MTSRERVLAALEFRGPDRAPRNLWALAWVGQNAWADLDRINREFPDDLLGLWGHLAPSPRRQGQEGRRGRYVDDWGCVWEAAEDGLVGEVKGPPLADYSALGSFKPPWEMIRRADWGQLTARADEARRGDNPPFLMAGTTVRPFERMQFLRGSQNLLTDLGEDSAPFRSLRRMVHEFFLAEMEATVRQDVDAVFFMDDWGTQTSLLISPAMWRECFKPLYRDYCDLARRHGKKVFFHSDGHILDIYEDLIEIGVHAVNSQLFCMDIEEIARRFRGRIAFWGEIDRQHVLPFGSVHDVRRAVARVRRALDDGRGGLIAQCEWGVNNPPANIRAVFEAWEAPLASLPA